MIEMKKGLATEAVKKNVISINEIFQQSCMEIENMQIIQFVIDIIITNDGMYVIEC